MSIKRTPAIEVMFCDRCGSAVSRIEERISVEGSRQDSHSGMPIRYDFCSDCVISFDAWIREKEATCKTEP